MPYPESLARLEEKYLYRRDAVINPSLDNITKILELLGNPQRKVSSIQVTGTNGKTSVSWMIGAILNGQGVRTAVYTSPHLVSFRERIRIDGEPVAPDVFEKYLRMVAEVIDEVDGQHAGSGGRPQVSGFEVLTAVMFSLLEGEGVGTAVLEVGMGGRWDATSLADVKSSVITNVSLDHTDILGATEVEIANEKAQVIRAGNTTFTAETQPEVLAVFSERADEVGAELQIHGKDFESRGDLPLKIIGEHQVTNLGLAVACAEGYLGQPLDGQALNRSVEQLSIPGRLEVIQGEPQVVLDGAHNPDAAVHLTQSLTAEPSLASADGITFVLAVLSDKDCAGILKPLLTIARKVIVTQVEHGRSMSSADLMRQVAEFADPAVELVAAASIPLAIEAAQRITSQKGLICVTGSLYTVGAARAHLLDLNPG